MIRETSLAALESMKPHITANARKVLDYIRYLPSTNYEVGRDTGMKPQSVSARMNELSEKGYVVDSGARRKTDTGRNAIVWRHRDL